MTPLAISSMVLKPLQSAYTWRRKDKSLLFKYCPAQCPFVVHQRVVKNFSVFVYLRDMGYYRSHFFLGRRENKNVICSVAFNFGLTAFLAVAASLHMKLNLIHFFLFSHLVMHLGTLYKGALTFCQGYPCRKSTVCLPTCSGDSTWRSQHPPLLKVYICLLE